MGTVSSESTREVGAGQNALSGSSLTKHSATPPTSRHLTDRPACWHCLKSATLKMIPHSQSRCYHRSFDPDGNELLRDWPVDQPQRHCSTAWTGHVWDDPSHSREPSLDVSTVKSILGLDGGLDKTLDRECGIPVSMTHSRMLTLSGVPLTPVTSFKLQ